MQPNLFSVFHLLLALSLFFALTSALPHHSRLDDVTQASSVAQVAQRAEVPSTGRLHARSFGSSHSAAPSHTHMRRHHQPAPSPIIIRDEAGADAEAPERRNNLPHFHPMENSLRGKTKVYSGNYWRRKVYHL